MRVARAILSTKQIGRLLEGHPILIRLPGGTQVQLVSETYKGTEEPPSTDFFDRMMERFERLFNGF